MLTWFCAKSSSHIDGKELAIPCQNFLFTLSSWSEGGLRTYPAGVVVLYMKAQGAPRQPTRATHPDLRRRCAAVSEPQKMRRCSAFVYQAEAAEGRVSSPPEQSGEG